MDVKVLNSNNFVSLTANYDLDEQVKLDKDFRNSYHGLNLTLDQCLSSTRDTSTNKYSNFYLSNDFSYNNFLNLDNLELPEGYVFTTYIAINSTGGITSESRYLTIDNNNPLYNNTFSYNFESELNQNYGFFEIKFFKDYSCTISNTIDITKRYLAYDKLSTSFKFITAYNDDLSLFNYIYDEAEDLLIISKKIYDKENYITYDISTSKITMLSSLSGIKTFDTFKTTQIFNLKTNPSSLNAKLSTSNYVYMKPDSSGVLKVDLQKSTYDYNTNFFFNNEFYSIKPYKLQNLNLNILNLKNQKTVNNEQSFGGVFINQPAFKHRYYENLFTGVNQEKGNYNIGLGFASYTVSKILKPDTLNYFHIPFDIYPYQKLNVNDSSLVISGAIPSDTPYYSDKIFKRLNDYKYSSNFGDVTDTQTGAYLCTWLSGGETINDEGNWVDRYYNPRNISYYEALTNPSEGLVTNFDTISGNVGIDFNAYDIFDKKSDLTFEKGSLYAYHHVGNVNAQTYVNDLSGNIIFDNFKRYFDKDYIKQDFVNEIYFNGNYFAKALDTPLDNVSTFDNFSVNFDIKIEDNTKPIGSQIVGNYSDRGFGIYNYRRITPHTVSFKGRFIYIFNSFGELLKELDNETQIIQVVKNEPNGNFFVFDTEGNVTKYNYIGTTLDKKYIQEIDNENNSSFYAFGKFIFILNGLDWYRLDSTSLKIVNGNTLSNYTVKKLGDEHHSIAVKDNVVCLLSGTNPKFLGNEVYFYNKPSLQYFNINDDSIGFKLEVSNLNDYTFDSVGNLYGIYDNIKVCKVNTLDYNVLKGDNALLSSYTGIEFSQGKCIDVINEFYNGELNTNLLSVLFLSAGNTGSDFYIPSLTKIDTNFSSPSSTTSTLVLTESNSFDNNTNINNFDYLRNNYNEGETLTCKLRLPNVFDVQTYEIATLEVPLSSIGPGYHNFSVSLDTTKGLFNLVLDGINIDSYTFQDSQYSFGTIFDNAFYIGTEPSYGNNKLNENLRDVNYYNYGNFYIKDFYMYNKPLYLYDVANIIRSRNDISDLYFQLPTGKRSFIENVDKFFKFKLPGRKSNQFNIKVLDTGITEKSLQDNISKNINENIVRVIPANTRLNNIDWEVDND